MVHKIKRYYLNSDKISTIVDVILDWSDFSQMLILNFEDPATDENRKNININMKQIEERGQWTRLECDYATIAIGQPWINLNKLISESFG